MAKNTVLIRSKLKKADEFLRQNNLPEATKLYERVCQLDGGNAELWSRLGILKRQLGDYPTAESCCRKALQLSPASPLTHHALGAALQSQNRPNEAIPCYRKALELQPDLTEAHYFLANALRESGDPNGAATAYEALLELNPDHFEGLNNYGALLTNIGKPEDATKLLAHALEINSNSVQTLTNLARAQTLIGAQHVAIDLLKKSLALQPDFIDTQIELAVALRLDGQHEEALAWFDKVLDAAPGNTRALVGKATTYEMLGNRDDAYALLAPLLDGTTEAAALPVFFDISKAIGMRDKAVALIQNQLATTAPSAPAAAPLHFRLGKHFDEHHEYDFAFAHFDKANICSQRYFDIDKTRIEFDSIRQTYSKAFIDNMPRATTASELPVFIVGMPRSGTSLLEQVLASHPGVYGAGETVNVHNLCTSLSRHSANRPFPDFVPTLSQPTLDRAAKDFLQMLSALSPSSQRVTDKTPHNFVFTGLLLQLFPNCRIINCRRNPVDTCLSCYFSEFASNFHNYAYDLRTLGLYYSYYSALMTHWTSAFPERIFELRYEDLVENQERTTRSALEHCGLEWNQQCLDFHQLDRVVNTISYDQVRQPLYKRSVNRWRNYESHVRPLLDALEQHGVDY